MSLNFEVKVDERSAQKAEGLMKTTGYDRNRKPYPKSDWRFLGLSESGPGVLEEARVLGTKIMKYMQKEIKIGTTRKTKV
jgi:hypothetical protein